MPRASIHRLIRCLGTVCLCGVPFWTPTELDAQVIVERLGRAAAAALEPGDRLLAWNLLAEGASGSLVTWSDPERLDIEVSPRGPVRLHFERRGRAEVAELPALELGIAGRPPMKETTLREVEKVLAEPSREGSAERIAALVGDLPGSARSWALTRLAEARRDKGDLPGAVAAFQAAADADEGPFAAELLRRAGEVALRTGRTEEAESLFRRALESWEGHEPGGLGASTALAALGSLQARRHEFEAGRRTLARACGIRERLAPGSWFLANCLNNQGVLHGRSGDLGLAEARFLEALEIRRGLGDPGTKMLANLGVVARLRGDLERARLYVEQALTIHRRNRDAAAIEKQLNNLGNILIDLEDYPAAIAAYSEGVEILEALGPGTPDLAQMLMNRGKCRIRAGDHGSAASDLARARRILGFEEPRTPIEATLTQLEGEIAVLQGDLVRAVEKLSQGLRVQARLRPDSSYEAEPAALLARVRAARGEDEEAEALFQRAIRAVERQQQRVGGGDRGLVAFRRKHAPIYRMYQEFLRESGRNDAAFELHERSRAQGLRALLSGREIDWTPAGDPEIGRMRDELRGKIESKYRELAGLDARDDEGRLALQQAIEALHAARDGLSARLYEASPRSGRLEVPPALDLRTMRSRLPRGILVLAYSVGSESTTLFSLDGDGLATHDISVGRDALMEEVTRWAELLTSPRPGRELEVRGERLGDLLLEPVSRRLATAEGIVIVPDGPLHSIPFAALPAPGEATGRRLLHLAPIERAPSVSVYLGSPRTDRGAGEGFERVLVLGDPAASEEAVARYRRELGRLPSAREEARAVQRQFGDRSRVLLGEEATEEAVRQELPGADLAHFACHAVVDEALPMDSALILAPGGDSSGLLQAWEIVEDLDVQAGLVVLSACQTARGAERAGEGMVGLVRSLQIAGARRVLASLWNVNDESTAVLMQRFYRYLGRGERPAAALRRAQLDLLSGPVEMDREGHSVRLRLDAPRHWAPFVLTGMAD